MSEHLEHEVANLATNLRDLDRRLANMAKSQGGVLLPGPGGEAVSRVEFNKHIAQSNAQFAEWLKLTTTQKGLLDECYKYLDQLIEYSGALEARVGKLEKQLEGV
jgi:hypothetical protein